MLATHRYRSKPKISSPTGGRPLLQPQLKIGERDDKYEKEAEQMADTVMRMPDTPLQMQPLAEEEEEENLQIKPSQQGGRKNIQMLPARSVKQSNDLFAPAYLTRQINSSSGHGRPLAPDLQHEMSHKIGEDFGNIAIHADSQAAGMNRALGSRAFTTGNNIYFNSGEYNPDSVKGKHLLAHELTHTIQQGSSTPSIQKKDGDMTPTNTKKSDPLAKLLSGLIRKELADKKFQEHLSKLGKALGELALKETEKITDRPSGAAERLTALNIPQLFKTTSKEIVKDPQLKYIRKRLVEIVGTNDLTALIAALAGGLAAYLADVDLTGKPSVKIGAGFTLGGMFNLGSAKDIQFKEIQHYVQYSNEHFKAQLTGGLKNKEADDKTGEEKHLVGTGTGEIRLGTKLSHFMTRVSYNSDGQLVVLGRLSSGTTFGKNEKLIFTADVSHMFATGETLFTPKIAGRFNLGSDQTLSIGSSLQLSNQKGLNKLTGFIEYKQDLFYLRIEGSMQGFEGVKSISPGNEMKVQGRLIIPLF